jgi:agmatinase
MAWLLAGLASATAAEEPPTEPWQDPSNPSSVILNPDDPTLNLWRERRDTSNDPKREPGPINLERYKQGFRYHGMPTFLHQPVALTPEDLVAGKVDVAIFGAPMDFSMVRGAGLGPMRVRGTVIDWSYYGAKGLNPINVPTMVDPMEVLNVVDYGNAAVDVFSLERSHEELRKITAEVAGAGARAMVIGGDHSLPYGIGAGLADVHGKKSYGYVHFDTHYDLAGFGFGHFVHNGRAARLLMEQEMLDPKHVIQVGLRGLSPGPGDLDWMRAQGIRYHYMEEIDRDGWDTVKERVLKEAEGLPDKLYVSVDLDVLDGAYVPGTAGKEPGGLTPRELFPLLRALCIAKECVAVDIVEYNPLIDQGEVTAVMVDRIMREFLAGMALRKQGITDPNYRDPRVLDDGAN